MTQRHLGRHRSSAPHDLVYRRRSHAEFFRELVRAKLQRLHQVVEQNIARMYRTQLLHRHKTSFVVTSVVFDDLNLERVTIFPNETSAPLFVDPDAETVLPGRP